MEKHYYFDRNLLALSAHNNMLCSKLSSALTTLERYRFIEGKDGALIPAWVDANGTAHTLHSLISPEREAEKITASICSEGYIILFGLGAGFVAQAALKKNNVEKLLVIDYDIDGIAELLCSKEYIELFSDPRFSLLVDAKYNDIVSYILENYMPCLHNGIRVIPLRARCDFDEEHFLPAADAVRSAINRVSQDYSVQAYFGLRWFSNIVRNITSAEAQQGFIPPVRNAAICAAGPSLDIQLELLQKKQNELFIIATDTALGSLIAAGIKPNAVISIDCQHISYLHFMYNGFNRLSKIPLFLDLASPPLLTEASEKSFFFSSGHPLSRYISLVFKDLISIDTSGGNVSYAAVSLAEKLGAKKIELYGADFAYPEGITYTKGAYFYPYLQKRATRFNPSVSQAADFLFKNSTLKKTITKNSYYYETNSLASYREKIEEQACKSEAQIIHIAGQGAPVNIPLKPKTISLNNVTKVFFGGKTRTSAASFLCDYKAKIASLPLLKGSISEYIFMLGQDERLVWTTLIPVAAALKQREKINSANILVERIKSFCIAEIERTSR
ncbi:MAG: hypothetical protein Pg6A_17350 [Termitinemataceae bacterium]|nr:MAG: hypothetical protein Pg6A_17350 [Termitinemataceae bacterium]